MEFLLEFLNGTQVDSTKYYNMGEAQFAALVAALNTCQKVKIVGCVENEKKEIDSIDPWI